ncbi:MAG: hypothetical protein ICV60_16495 [Pyrinomonadaceae bacterium]|nr:hypothetical protein [Pyrinomonadaceae bacterium]
MELISSSRIALPLVIDDHAPPPAHTLPNKARALKILMVGLTLWSPLAELMPCLRT